MSHGTMKLEGNVFKGVIRTMRINLTFRLEKIQIRRSENAPDYNIVGRAPAGHAFQAGVAWERTMKRGDNVGQSMFSLSLEDPEFGDQPVYLSAFPNGQGGYDLTLERKRGEQVSSAPTQEAAGNSDMPFEPVAA